MSRSSSRTCPAGSGASRPGSGPVGESSISPTSAATAGGYRHMKLKIDAHTDPERLRRTIADYPNVSFGADANQSLADSDGRILEAIDGLGLAFLEQPGEEPLLPAVVLRRTGGQLPLPVIAEAQALQLTAHVVDVLVSPPGRRHLVLDGRPFRRQAEGVPAHGLEHVLPEHALVARDHVPDGVIAHVAHVQATARVGEHGQAIVFFPGLVLQRPKRALLVPLPLDAHLDFLMPGYTHLQRAQPVLLSHHLLAYVEMLQRDRGRVADRQRQGIQMIANRRRNQRATAPPRPARAWQPFSQDTSCQLSKT